jgi:hypothetical protein
MVKSLTMTDVSIELLQDALDAAEGHAMSMRDRKDLASPQTDAIVCQLETIATLLRGLPRADHDATTR